MAGLTKFHGVYVLDTRYASYCVSAEAFEFAQFLLSAARFLKQTSTKTVNSLKLRLTIIAMSQQLLEIGRTPTDRQKESHSH